MWQIIGFLLFVLFFGFYTTTYGPLFGPQETASGTATTTTREQAAAIDAKIGALQRQLDALKVEQAQLPNN